MKNEILLFAGTTEGRKLSECLAAAGIVHTVCVATEYGEIVLNEHPAVKVHRGRMNGREMAELIQSGGFAAVVDATHPYAEAVTENIKTAVQGLNVPYFRLKRETNGAEEAGERVIFFDTMEACAKALEQTEGNILLTTGSKELGTFCVSQELKSRLYVRVLPGIESITLCMEQGISGKQILALQGPFTTEMNEAMMRQYRIKYLVTKASGRTGGFPEKLEAAKNAGITVFVIGRLGKDDGDSFQEICQKLENICGRKIKQPGGMDIILAGIGMGSGSTLTGEVCQAIESADILLGAERMIAGYHPRLEKKPFFRADRIIPYLKELQKNLVLDGGKVVILFSGDSGFCSGCQTLYQALQSEITTGGLRAFVRIMPGISSIAYLAACIGESYQDACIASMHGKELPGLVQTIKREKKTFLLLSGAKDVRKLGGRLLKAGMNECEISVGYQLSYPEQQIRKLTPEECLEVYEEGLYTCCIRNPQAEEARLTHGKADTEFIRDKIPMTKEEVREVSICKLKLRKGAVVYDIGSGTGSIAIEIAGLSEEITVFAIERKEEAVSLIKKNQEKFQLDNITVVAGEAPEGLDGLPVPTHAFIGGSGGRLREMLSYLYQENPRMRIVINAVSMETICEIKDAVTLYPIEQEEIVQIQASRARKAGQYHLMQAENPVWICAFTFCPDPRHE